jgi:hypothetical protein
MAQEKKAPFKTFRAGKMNLGLWRNEVEEDDRTVVNYSIKIQKRYMEKQSEEWKTAKYLYLSDVPNLILCAQKAFEFLSLKEGNNDDNQVTARANTFEEETEVSQPEEQKLSDNVDDMLDDEELPVI